MGAAMGAAMTGLKPIAEIMFSDFFAVCFDYIANEFPKSRYMSNGQVKCPLVVRTGNGAGSRFGAQHQPERRELVHDDPGAQGGGAVDAARRHRPLGGGGARSRSGHLPRAQVALRDQRRGARRRNRRHARHRQDRAPRQGCHHHRAGADGAARARGGRETQGGTRHRLRKLSMCARWCRSTRKPSSARSRKTHRLFTVEENPRLCGWGAEIVSIVADEAFYDLDGPPVRITTPHIPLPAADILEDAVLPTPDRIADTVGGSVHWQDREKCSGLPAQE